MMTQNAGFRIVETQRGDIGADAATQRRCNGAKEFPRVEMRDHRVGHIEKQIQLIALSLQDGQQIGQLGI